MKFIVDAQLTFRLAKHLKKKGYDVIHTDNLPNKEQTTDNEIRDISVLENRVVITKDNDFLRSFLIKGIPPKLLLVTTGNISNKHLLQLFDNNFESVIELFVNYNYIELGNDDLTGHY